MVWNLGDRPIAELISLYPHSLTHFEKLLDKRLVLLQKEKQDYKFEYENRSVEIFGVDMSISFFNQLKEFFHQVNFKELVAVIKSQSEK